MPAASVEERLTAWLGTQLPGARALRVVGLDRVAVGHSAETLLFTLVHDDRAQDLVVRVRPPAPGLLEPYDLGRQFAILRALAPTPVRAPRVLWHEPSGSVLGREFYVMERLPGTVYERSVPADLAADPRRVRRMCESMVEQIAAIHTVDLTATGLDAMGSGADYVSRELDHWSEEIRRVRRGPMPALDRLMTTLRQQQPERAATRTLVHGDPKPGNFAFVNGEVTAVFDWELATIGDPQADLGWTEVLWSTPNAFTALPGALSTDEFVARWAALTGLSAGHRAWYRALESLKMAVILLVGGHLYDRGHSDDPRLLEMTYVIPAVTRQALCDLGVHDALDPGPVSPPRRPA